MPFNRFRTYVPILIGVVFYSLSISDPTLAARRPVSTDEKLDRELREHFEIWSQQELSQADHGLIRHNLDRVRREVGRDLDAYPNTKFKVIVTDAKVFQSYSGEPKYVGGLFDGSIHIPVPSKIRNKKYLKSILWHEYTHAVIWSRTKHGCPLWLNEGFAEYEQAKVFPPQLSRLVKFVTSKRELPYSWKQLKHVFRYRKSYSPKQIQLAYLQAYAVVRYLFKRYRKSQVSDLLDEFNESRNFERAIKKVFRTDLDKLERRVILDIKKTVR